MGNITETFDFESFVKQKAEQATPQGRIASSDTEKKEAQDRVINYETGVSNDDTPVQTQKEDDKEIVKTHKELDMIGQFVEDMRNKYGSTNKAKSQTYTVQGSANTFKYGEIKKGIRQGTILYNPDGQQLIWCSKIKAVRMYLRPPYDDTGTYVELPNSVAERRVKQGTAIKVNDTVYRVLTQEEENSQDANEIQNIKNSEPPEYKNSPVATTEHINTKLSDKTDSKCDRYVYGNNPDTNSIITYANQDKSLGFSNPNSNPSGMNKMKSYAVSTKTEPSWDNYFKTEKVKGKDVTIKTSDFTDTVLAHLDSTDDIDTAMSTLTYYVTKDVISQFGANQIREIQVSESRLFINGMWYKANLSPSVMQEDIPKGEYLYYLGKGLTAYFFDWSYIKSFNNLIEIDIDDAKYVKTVVSQTACKRGNAGVNTFFRLQPKLDTLIIGKEKITRDKLNTPEASNIKKSVGKSARSFHLLNGWTLNNKSFYEVTDSVQSFGVNSFTNYINNRGNRGFIRFALGSTLRFGLAGVTTVANLGLHVIGGLGKALKDGITPVEDNMD